MCKDERVLKYQCPDGLVLTKSILYAEGGGIQTVTILVFAKQDNQNFCKKVRVSPMSKPGMYIFLGDWKI